MAKKWPKNGQKSRKNSKIMPKKSKNGENATKGLKYAEISRNKMHLENFDTSKFNVKIRNIFCIYFYENLKNVKND